MRKLGDGHDVIAGAVRSEFRVGYLKIDDAVDGKLGVVAGDADLAGHVQRDFFERVFVGQAVDKGNQDVQAGVEDFVETPQPLDDIGFLLRYDDKRFEAEHDDGDENQKGKAV